MNELLTIEDIAFLKKLANELAIQDTACTAKPVYYSILEKKIAVGIDENYAEGMCLGGSEGETFLEKEEAIEYVIENHFDEEDDDAEKIEELRGCEDLEEIYNFCDDHGIEMHYTGYNIEETYKEMFLTKAALKEHIRLNHYHYKEPVSFCHHAWRNPELEKLLTIIEKFADAKIEEINDEQNRSNG